MIITSKRFIDEHDREVYRENALKGTAKTKGKPKVKKSKYGVFSWGFAHRGSKTTNRKHKEGKVISKIFRKDGKQYTALVRKEEKGKGKKPFIVTILTAGKSQSHLGHSYQVESDSFPKAADKAIKEFKKR